MTALKFLPVLMLALESAPGQQIIWDMPPSSSGGYQGCFTFGDFNRDGVNDFISVRYLAVIPAPQYTLCILSGLNGSPLYQHSNFYGAGPVGRAGDFDGDGYEEYHWTESGARIHVHSARRGVELFFLPPLGHDPGLRGDYGYAREPRIDLDGDGRSDFLVATVTANNSSVFAYNHLGALVYTIPVLIHGWVVRSLANVGDRDGDGGEDFLAGAMGGAQNEGAVFLVSGRTGTVLRTHLGLQPNDMIGGKVMEAGDLDRDGVTDFLGSNENSLGSGRQITIAWSGATSALIRVWQDPGFLLGTPVSAKHDIDMDGIPDVLFACPGCFDPVTTRWGAVKAASSRDGWILQDRRAQVGQGAYGDYVADLGVRPGNPHPVYVTAYFDQFLQGGRLEFWRSEPPRSSLTGTGCSTSGTPLVPGLRTTPTGSRLQLANAPPGALAWCILGDGNATTTSGYPLPVALDPLGFAGCSLLVPMDYVGVTTTGTVGIDRGYAAFDLPVALAATAGRRFAVQWLVLDPVTGFEAWTSRRDFWVQ